MEENTPESVDQELASSEAPEAPESVGDDKSLEYEKGVSLSDKLQRNPDALTNSQIADLEKLDKVRYNGKVITGKELAKELKDGGLRQSDYTNKSKQLAAERKVFAEERKFYEALGADLKQLRDNPDRIDEFKAIYPAKFHQYLDLVESKALAKQEAVQNKPDQAQEQKTSLEQDPRFQEMYKHYQDQRFETAKTQVYSVFDRLAAKHFSDLPKPTALKFDRLIAADVQAERDAWMKDNPGETWKLDESRIEKIFQEYKKDFESSATDWNAKRFNAQKAASEKSKGPGAGGGIPGGAPKVARTIQEATELALADPGFN